MYIKEENFIQYLLHLGRKSKSLCLLSHNFLTLPSTALLMEDALQVGVA